jgi:hypothetical protein
MATTFYMYRIYLFLYINNYATAAFVYFIFIITKLQFTVCLLSSAAFSSTMWSFRACRTSQQVLLAIKFFQPILVANKQY